LIDLVCSEIEKDIIPITIETVANRLCRSINNISGLPEDYTQYDNWLWLKSEQLKLENKIINYLKVAHKSNPLDYLGKPREEFMPLIHAFPESAKTLILKSVLESMCENAVLKRRGVTFALATHFVKLDKNDFIQINWVDQFILNQKMKVPLWLELVERCAKKGIDEKKLKQIIGLLVSKERVIYQDGEYIHKIVVERAKEKLIEYLAEHPEGITVGELRDLLNGNRKICILLLSIYDKEGLTARDGDRRYLAHKK